MRKCNSVKSIANRYGYPLFISSRDWNLYFSDWVEYSNRNKYKEINKGYTDIFGTPDIKELPRNYGYLKSFCVNYKGIEISMRQDYCPVWILPDKKYRKKGRVEAFKDPQEISNMLRFPLIVYPYGGSDVLIKNKKYGSFSNTNSGSFDRMICKSTLKNIRDNSQNGIIYEPQSKRVILKNKSYI